jgi:uncharacterized protein YndB with AHSA1/START domain
MGAITETSLTTQVYRVYIKATPQAVWDAITNPEWTQRYGYGGRGEYDLKPGGSYTGYTSDAMKKAGAEKGYTVPDIAVDGEIIEADPPRRLVQTWRMLMDDAMRDEGFTRLTYELVDQPGGVTRLTLIHDLAGAPSLALVVSGQLEDEGAGGGWSWVLSDLKSLLETGSPLDPSQAP